MYLHVRTFLERTLHTYAAALTGLTLSTVATISAPQFVQALTPVLGNVHWAANAIHALNLIGVVLALNGKGAFTQE